MNAVYGEAGEAWVSAAEVAEIPFTEFTSQKKAERITGRLVVRRIPELNPKRRCRVGTLFDAHRFRGVFSNVAKDALGTVDMDKTHRQHAIIESVNAELKDSALAHMSSGKFNANAAWLQAAAIAFNLSRAAGILAGGRFTCAKMRTLQEKLVLFPARIASSARKIKLHLPQNKSSAQAWTRLFTSAQAAPQMA